MPRSRPARPKVSRTRSSCAVVCAAFIWVRIRALPCGTTGNAKATTYTPSAALRQFDGEGRLAEHDRNDGMFAGNQIEAERPHAVAEVSGIAVQPLAKLGRALQQVEHLEGGGRDRRGDAVREQVRAGTLPQPSDDLPARRDVAAAGAAQGLAERTRHDVDAIHDAAIFVRAAAVGADEAGGVRIVHHDQRPVPIGQVTDIFEFRDGAIHREHAVGRDQTHSGILRVLQGLLELIHVVVGIAQPASLAEANSIDDAGVVQGVADDGILIVQQRFKETAVGVEAGRIQNRVLHRQVGTQALLEFAVNALRSADEANRGHAVAVAGERIVRGRDHRRVIGEPEIIVGAEVDHLAAVGERHHRTLR